MNDPHEQPDSRHETLPNALVDDLADLYDARILVPEHVDDQVLSEARQHLAPVRRRRFRLRVWGAAAAVILAAGLTITLIGTHQGPTLRQDINGDGVVDILDAFAVARGIENRTQQADWDVNGDGDVDRRDVDDLAMLAVTLRTKDG